MRNSIVANRYARALYNLSREKGVEDRVFDEMRVLESAFSNDSEIRDFIYSPVIRPVHKEQALAQMVKQLKIVDPLGDFLLLLAKKNRLSIFSDIVKAYQVIADDAHGVTRGVVRTATVLGPEERKRLEELVSRATKKQTILTYKEDSSLLGGLVAQVGSFTFDDSLDSHLIRINEQLTRSVH